MSSVGLSGWLLATTPSGADLTKDIARTMSPGEITPAPVPVLTDSACGSASTLAAIDPASNVRLGPKGGPTVMRLADNTVTFRGDTFLNLTLDTREACGQPLVATTPLKTGIPVTLNGKLGTPGGLNRIALSMPAKPVRFKACLSHETPKPLTLCAVRITEIPGTIALDVVVRFEVVQLETNAVAPPGLD